VSLAIVKFILEVGEMTDGVCPRQNPTSGNEANLSGLLSCSKVDRREIVVAVAFNLMIIVAP
jgi:hypothetical protein